MKNMQKMNTTKGALLGLSVGAAALIAAACSGDKTNTTTVPGATTTAPTAVVPPVGATTTGPVGATTGPVGATTSGATGATTTGATGAVPPPVSTCTTVDAFDNDAIATAAFPGVAAYYGYGDGKTSLCPTAATVANTLCIEGNAVSSKGETNDYEFFGAGVGLQMAGSATAAWDAAAVGVVGVKFTTSGVAGRKVRVQMSQINDPADATKEYDKNSFVWGGSKYSSKELKAGGDGEQTLLFAEVGLPEWSATALGLEEDALIDPTKIASLAFQVVNGPADDTEIYTFCISNLQWIDAAGAPVAVVPPETGTDTGGTDTGASAGSGTGTDTGVSGGSDTSAPATSASGGSDTSAPAAIDFTADIQPIFTAKCAATGCHAAARGMGMSFPSLAAGEPDAAAAAEIKTWINGGGEVPMPPSTSTQLTDDEKAAIIAWADSKQ